MRSRGRSPTRADMCLETRSRTDPVTDRKSTRLNSSHDQISYAVFCLKKKKPPTHTDTQLHTAVIRILNSVQARHNSRHTGQGDQAGLVNAPQRQPAPVVAERDHHHTK